MSCLEKDKVDRFNAIFRKYYNKVIYFSLHYVDTYEEAQDIANDVFTAIWQNLDNYIDNIYPRIIVITKHKCLNSIRKTKNMRLHLKQGITKRDEINWITLSDSSIEHLIEKDTLHIIQNALDKMPEKTREAFVLSRFKDKSYSEIAAIQNVSEKNVEYRISSALKFIRRAFAGFFMFLSGFIF